jgi:NitT/TauT family transport system substrate-binding protein
MRRMKFLFLAVVLAGTMFLSACGSSSKESSGSESKTIKIGFSALPSWYLWHLVDQKGFFDKYDVDVELVWFPVYADSLSALNTGKIDGNTQALLDAIPPLDKGIDLKTIFITDNSIGGDGIVATNDIQSVEDLKGRSVGTELGTIEHFFLLTALEDAGMQESDVKFTNLSVPDAGNAFLSGNIDAAGLWEPFLSKAIAKEGTHKLVTSADYPGLVSDVFVVREDVTKEKQEELQKVVNAWFDAVTYFEQNPEESIGIIAKEAGITVEELTEGFKGFKMFTPEENLSSFKEGDSYDSFYYTAEKNAEFLKRQGYVDGIPDFTDFVDSSFVENVSK